MKTKLTGITSLFVLSTYSFAGNISNMPHQFTANTEAVASEVNKNFEALRLEINDNAASISSNSDNIDGMPKTTGKCEAGEFVVELKSNGSIICQEDSSDADTLNGKQASDFVESNQLCPSGSMAGIDVSGKIICTQGVAFSAILKETLEPSNATEIQLSNFGVFPSFNEGNHFDNATGVFTVPSDGIYEFSMNVGWRSEADLSNKISLLRIKINGTIHQQSVNSINPRSSWTIHSNLSAVIKANQGDQITFHAHYASAPTPLKITGGLGSGSTNVSGVKLY